MFQIIKKTLKYLVVVSTLVLGGSVLSHYVPRDPQPTTLQRQASHKIEYYRSGRRMGQCTGTAIAPHALLTASHCNKDAAISDIRFDLSERMYHIEKFLHDDTDHDIYLVDGPPFTNFVDYKVRDSQMGEHVYLYGSGGGEYPPRRLDGTRVYWDDPSDVDADAGISHFSMPVIPGDSGSAVYADDGSIVAVTTFQWNDRYLFGYIDDITTVDFLPAFTSEQIVEALSFAPTVYQEPKAPEESLPTFTIPLFGFK